MNASYANNLVNILFSMMSNRPTKAGVYTQYAKDDIEAVIAHFEQDFLEMCSHLDAEGLTRFAQTLYLMKSKNFENVWWRIENRVHELAEEAGALDHYHITNILRSFSRS